jgi:hypothetical protein
MCSLCDVQLVEEINIAKDARLAMGKAGKVFISYLTAMYAVSSGERVQNHIAHLLVFDVVGHAGHLRLHKSAATRLSAEPMCCEPLKRWRCHICLKCSAKMQKVHWTRSMAAVHISPPPAAVGRVSPDPGAQENGCAVGQAW